MEAVKESAVKESSVGESASFVEAGQGVGPALGRALDLVRSLGPTAVADAALLGFGEAAEFAAGVEKLSRAVEYLQLVAAGAVDRTRNLGSPAAAANSRSGAGWGSAPDGVEPAATGWSSAGERGPADHTKSDVVDDGFRNTAEFLRERLRISAVEARRRLVLAGSVLARPGTAWQQLPPEREELAGALAAGAIASRAASIITVALDQVRYTCPPESSARMEHALTLTAAGNDQDFLARVARRWTDALDQDGTEPSEEELRRLQGAFIRRSRHSLHHLEIFATADQFEQLLTVMNTATNPRTAPAAGSAAGSVDGGADGDGSCDTLDRRSRPQKLLDGLVGACKAALAAGALPVTGGLRPQVLVTIDFQDLLGRLGESGTTAGSQESGGLQPSPGRGRQGSGQTGTLMFTGPVTASTIRKIACDADIIPVVLGGEGRILDIGRASRVFPPHLRKAITARDRGCAFPNCTIPAPWCEAHHISYWSRGGVTSTDNGALLCTHHHHLVHKEQWRIQVRTGTPWFIPPPHVDPHQEPRRNHYFRLG